MIRVLASQGLRSVLSAVLPTALGLVVVGTLAVPQVATAQTGSASAVQGESLTNAESPLPLSVEAAVVLALDNNLDIRSEELDLLKRFRAESRAWNVFIPELSASATLARPHQNPRDNLPASSDEDDVGRWVLRPQLEAELILNLRVFQGIRAVRLDYETGRISLEIAQARLELEVRKAFYDILLQWEQYLLAEQRLDSAVRRYEDAQINFDNGLIDELSLLQTQVAVEAARARVLGAEAGYDNSLLGFKQVLGIPRGTAIVLEGSLESSIVELPETETLMQLVGRNPNIRLRRQAVAGSEIALADSRAQRYPTLRLGYTESPEFSSVSLGPQSLPGNPFSGEVADTGNWDRGGQFSITMIVPLSGFIPVSRPGTAIQNARTDLEKARLGLQDAHRQVETQLASLLRGIETTVRTIEVQELSVRLAGRALELAQESYDAGLRTLNEVRDAEIDLDEAQLDLLEQRKRYIELLLDLEFQLGTELYDLTRLQPVEDDER
ncbi:MAG: TolC family protein [Spirochaetaceae bacterium]|nr:MAG: TolC family protein [Spirochaetaceae bacterium]